MRNGSVAERYKLSRIKVCTDESQEKKRRRREDFRTHFARAGKLR